MSGLGRYLVFAYDRDKIKGGWGDFLTDFDDPERALGYINARRPEFDTIDVIDKQTGLSICPVGLARAALDRYRATVLAATNMPRIEANGQLPMQRASEAKPAGFVSTL